MCYILSVNDKMVYDTSVSRSLDKKHLRQFMYACGLRLKITISFEQLSIFGSVNVVRQINVETFRI